MELTRQNIGNAGEFFVAYQLERRGITVVHANTIGFDILAIAFNGEHIPIQVKATTKTQRTQTGRKAHKTYYSECYRFNLRNPDKYPLHAFVALDLPSFILRDVTRPDGSYPKNNVLDISPTYFTDEAMEASIKEHLS